MPNQGDDSADALLSTLMAGVERLEAKFDVVDVTLRGERGENGLVAKVNWLVTRMLVLEQEAERRKQRGTRAQRADDPRNVKAAAEAWAIRVGAGLALLAFLDDFIRPMIGG